MTTVKIDGTELTNIQSVTVSFKRDHNGRGDLKGNPYPLQIKIWRDCSLKEDAQILPFEAASRNPKTVKCELEMPNAAGGQALNFVLENAFVVSWQLANISGHTASEILEISAGTTTLSAAGNNASYKVPLTIPQR